MHQGFRRSVWIRKQTHQTRVSIQSTHHAWLQSCTAPLPTVRHNGMEAAGAPASQKDSAWQIRHIKAKITLPEHNLKAVLYCLRHRAVCGWYYTLGKLHSVTYVSSAVLVCSPFSWRYSGDTFQGYRKWDGNTVLGLCSQQCHQTQEKVTKHQLAAKGKCTDCRGKEIPQKNCCPRLGRAKQRRSSQKSSPACCFLVLTESRWIADLYQKHQTLAMVIGGD